MLAAATLRAPRATPARLALQQSGPPSTRGRRAARPVATLSTSKPAQPATEALPEQLQNPKATAGAAVAPTPLSLIQTASSVPQMWEQLASLCGDSVAMLDPHHDPPAEHTFREVAALVRRFAAGLHAAGVQQGDRVSLFSEGSSRWMFADQGIMMAGAVGAVRGVFSIPLEDLEYILFKSQSRALVAMDGPTLDRLLPVLTAPEAAVVDVVVVLWGEPSAEAQQKLPGRRLLTFDQVLELGARKGAAFQPPALCRDDLASLAYTSGTGGMPKGVELTHGNFLYQLEALDFLGLRPGQTTVTYLPPWHAYGRALEYLMFSRGVRVVYSNLLRLKADLQAHQPDAFISVPLLLDTLHAKAMQAVSKAPPTQRRLAEAMFRDVSRPYVQALRLLRGTDLRYARCPPSEEEVQRARVVAATLAPLHRLAHHLVYKNIRRELGGSGFIVSGGGSLAAHLDEFYEIIGIQVLQGYGLTETSPVLTVRRKGYRHNVRGTIGPAIPGTELRIVDPATLQDVPDGQQGLILAKGPGVMRGYCEEAATKKAFPLGDGWFDTGDLGWRAPAGVPGSNMAGSIVITGRAKDTIVLSSGKNIEPQPLEDLVQCSPYIKFCVLLGSGHRHLGALVVPDHEALEERGGGGGPPGAEEVRALVGAEIARALLGRPGMERIHAFEVLREPFSIEAGTLTRTMKPRRPVIMQKYPAEVERVEAQLR